MMTSMVEDKSKEGSSSDEAFAINHMAFGATRVEVEENGQVALTCDPKEELDEKVAKEVVDVAIHWDMAHITSSDKFDDLDEGSVSNKEMTHMVEKFRRITKSHKKSMNSKENEVKKKVPLKNGEASQIGRAHV